jgi:RecA/RadA recombinase
VPGKLVVFARRAKKKYGGVVGRADTTPSDDRRLPSGSIRLDYALGGGYRVGWITTLYGKKSGGKTTTAIRGLVLSQNRCRNCYRMANNVEAVPPSKADLAEDPEARWSAKGECTCYAEGLYEPEQPPKEKTEKEKDYKARVALWKKAMAANSYEEFVCCWIDPEGTFDKAYAVKLGLDNRRVLYIRPESAEEGIDLLHALVCTVEVDMLALDSIAQLVPTKELTESTHEWQQGLQARLMNKAVRKLVSGSSMVARQHRSVTQFWINQEREKIGTMYGDPTVKPGGRGQEFAVCAEIQFTGKGKKEFIEEVYGSEEKKEVIRIPTKETFTFRVTKDKTLGMKGVEGQYTQSSRANDAGPMGRVIEEEDIFKLALHFLVEQDKKAKKYRLCDREYSTQKAIMADLRDDPEFLATVKAALLQRMLRGAR